MHVIMCNQLLLFGIARTYGTGGYRHFSRLRVNVPSSAEVAARPEVWQRERVLVVKDPERLLFWEDRGSSFAMSLS